ncbi:hypothetical protein B0H10DRAFT_975302 [Mycena sp. CBHHK59/15]|nr:hypothetical protein B0H10DRAFT_975302 [Mycena sp. CBHHK59/15]
MLFVEPGPPFWMFCIPGANLAIFHTSVAGVSCWDVVTSQRVAHLEISNLHIQTNQPCLEIKGKVLIGGFVRVEDTGHLVAICIDFCDRDHISISHIVSPAINGMFINPIFFIKPQLLGFCVHANIISWHMDADIEVQSTPGDFDDPLLAQCLPFGRNLYVFHRLLGAETAIQRGLLPRAFEHHIPTFDAAAAHNNTTRLAIPYVPQRMQPRRNFRTRPRCNQVQSDSSVRPPIRHCCGDFFNYRGH